MATRSNILAWEIPWTEEPGGLQSMESWRAGHDWVTEHNLYICMHTHYTFFIHLSTDRHLGCLHVLTMNIGVHLSFLISAFVSFGSIPKCGVAGLYGGSIFNFFPILFYVVTTQIYFPINSVWGSFSPHPCQHLLFVVYLFIWLCWTFVAACRRFSSYGKQGLLSSCEQGLLTVA